MQPKTLVSSHTLREAHAPNQFKPIELENRPTVNTATAAYYLNRRPQTLRSWASSQQGPLMPIRIFGRSLGT